MMDVAVAFANVLKKTGTSLYTLNGTRVYVDKLPSDFVNTTTAILFYVRGGGSSMYVEEHDVDFVVQVYGGTPSISHARAVYLAMADLLFSSENLVVSGGCMLNAQVTSFAQDQEDPDTHHPYVLCFYRVSLRPI